MKSPDKFKKLINRQRLNPKIWDFSYLSLKNNLNVFKRFKNLLDERVNEKGKIKILDVGCGFKPWSLFFRDDQVEYIGVDFNKDLSSADFMGTAEKLPFRDNEFDALIYSEVLEHAEDLPVAIKEMRRVAKNKAFVFISTPFVFPEHGVPYDFQRLTRFYYEKIFKNDETVLLRESNSSLSTAIISFNLFIESSPLKIFKGIKHLIYIINNVLSVFVDAIIKFTFSKIGKRFKKYFYLMPLSFALIVRIKK